MKSSGVDLLDVGKLLREFQANQKHLRGVNGQNEKEANYYASDCRLNEVQYSGGRSPNLGHVIQQNIHIREL